MKNKTYIISSFLLAFVMFLGLANHSRALDVGVGGSLTVGATDKTESSLTGQVFPSSTTVAKAGTTASLSIAIDSLIQKTGGAQGDTFCSTLDEGMLEMDSTENTSLAWNMGSYKNLVALSADESISAEQKSTYDSLKESYGKMNDALSQAVDGNIGASLRAAASLRSAYIELLTQYRSGTPDESRVSSLKSFIQNARPCVTPNGATENALALESALTGSIGASTAPAQEESTVVTTTDIDESTATDVSVGSVSSKAEFATYAKSVLAKNKNITSVTGDTAHVEVVSKKAGKLFAFIPVSMKVKTSVMGDGKVTVKYPWYRFLVKVPAKVTSEMVLEKLPEEVTSSTTLSTHAQALSVNAIAESFTTVTTTDENASAATDTTTGTNTEVQPSTDTTDTSTTTATQ